MQAGQAFPYGYIDLARWQGMPVPDLSLTVPTASIERVRVRVAFVRDKRLGTSWYHAPVFALTGTWQSCSPMGTQ